MHVAGSEILTYTHAHCSAHFSSAHAFAMQDLDGLKDFAKRQLGLDVKVGG